MIHLDEILCEENRAFSDAEIQRMAVSIGNVGLLHPLLLCRKEPDACGRKYRLISGHRRYRALRLLERYEISEEYYRILETDEIALIQCVENMERKDLTITEEVAQLDNLAMRYDISELASILGRTEKYIRLRLQLGNLIEPLKKAMASGEKYPAMRLGHYEAIASYPHSCQQKLDAYYLEYPGTVSQFARVLSNQFRHLLIHAPFDTAVCAGCCYRTSAEPWLFEEFKRPEDDQCLNGECFERMTQRAQRKTVADEAGDAAASEAHDAVNLSAEMRRVYSVNRLASLKLAERLQTPEPLPRPDNETLLVLATLLPSGTSVWDRPMSLEAIDTIAADEALDCLWRHYVSTFARHAATAKRRPPAAQETGFDATAARICGIDFEKLRAEAEKEIPQKGEEQ